MRAMMAGLKIHSNREYIDSPVIGLSLRHATSLTDLSSSFYLSLFLQILIEIFYIKPFKLNGNIHKVEKKVIIHIFF